MLIFWILHVHEIGPFMPSSSVFVQLMLCALYRMIFGKKSLNVPSVKLFSIFYFQHFWAVRNPDFFLFTVCSVGKNLQNLEILIEKTNPDIFV